ncbi:importin-4 [Nematostella vectensis]|uniref:importin-4 n=1 Tax=Nematostella vectensis TaxID=45351 RepID=UPI0013904018|nr:importin-4 [Nematostella vectensis]XP_032225459.1 importin-4 [Nematostella vectensis]
MAELESILLKLLVPDNTVIQQATVELKEAFKHPAVIPSLMSILSTSQNPQVRQYAAVLLRRRVTKQWTKLPPENHQMLKQGLLQVLTQESVPLVRHSVGQVVSMIAKHELPAGQWPELLLFLQEYVRSQEAANREMGMFVLSSVTESVGEQLRPHFPSLLSLFSTTLEDQGSQVVPFYTIKALMNLIEYVGTDEIALTRPLIPKVVNVINALLFTDEDRACEAMEIFDELIESEVSIVTPHLIPLVEFSLKLAMNNTYSDNTRIKALHFICWLARIKPKALIKNNLLVPTLAVVFPIMAAPPSEEALDEEEDDQLEDGAEASKPCAVASQVLDILALHLPPETLIHPLMQFIQPALASRNPYERKAALIALAVIAEGCADFLRNRYLDATLQTICTGLQDTNHIVQNAALFALGQYSEHLQPEISTYSTQILPLLFSHLGYSTSNNKDQSSSTTRTYYALETFCENLGQGIIPYLPALMDKLMSVLSSSQNNHLKELAISALGAAANAAKENIIPYFSSIVELIKTYLTNPGTTEGNLLQVQAIDTLGVLARTVGPETFLPLADECIHLGLKLLEEDRDPDLRRCTFGLFASVSTILKTGISKFLPDIMKYMIDSLQSTEGIVTHYATDDDPSFLLEDEDLDDHIDDDDDDDDDITGYSVENSYLEEKEDTCNALGEVAESAGAEFLPYLDEASKEVLKLVQFPHTGVRKGAVTAMGQFCCVLHKALEETGAEDKMPLNRLLTATVAIYVTVITKDKDRSVVMATLQALNEMLKAIGVVVVSGEGHLEGIIAAIRAIFMQQTGCQENADDEDEDDDQQAEFDAMLIEYAGDALPALATAIGGQRFAPYFAGFLPFLLKRTKRSASTSDKSFAIGTISEVVLALEGATVPFIQHLYPVFFGALKDSDDEVRSNATYGLGLLAMNGGDIMLPHYPELLDALFSLMMVGNPNPRLTDNVCGAVCRMIMANRSAIPLDKVFPMLVQCLPLKEDFEENSTVYSCVIELFSDQHPQVMCNLAQLLGVFARVLPSPDLQQEVRVGLVTMIKTVNQQFPKDFEGVLQSLPMEHAQILLAASQS